MQANQNRKVRWEVRIATELDLYTLTNLELLCFPNDPWGENRVLPVLKASSGPALTWAFLIYIESSEARVTNRTNGLHRDVPMAPVGYLFGHSCYETAEIHRIAILRQFRRTGLASNLINFYVQSLLPNEVRSVFLEVRADNDAAVSFYQKHGFEVQRVRTAYYHDGVDAVIMALNIGVERRT